MATERSAAALLSTAAHHAALPHARGGAPLRRSFVVRPNLDTPSPLAALISSQKSSGGRGGHTRLALVLTALWVASQPPHEIQRPASWWAGMVGLNDPQGRSATRTVTQALRELARRDLVDFQPGYSGYPAIVALRSELGTGEPYQRPYRDTSPSYFRVPTALWVVRETVGSLDAAGLAMYLVLLSYHREDDEKPNLEDPGTWFSDIAFRQRHALSEKTRLDGLNQLVNLGVAVMTERVVDLRSRGGQRAVRRRFYTLEPPFTPPLKSTIDDPDVDRSAATGPHHTTLDQDASESRPKAAETFKNGVNVDLF